MLLLKDQLLENHKLQTSYGSHDKNPYRNFTLARHPDIVIKSLIPATRPPETYQTRGVEGAAADGGDGVRVR